jgi:hypothetical protein
LVFVASVFLRTDKRQFVGVSIALLSVLDPVSPDSCLAVTMPETRVPRIETVEIISH